MCRFGDWWARVRAALPPRRAARAAMLIVYGAAVLVGSSVFADLPDQVDRTIGHPLTITMASLLIIGGLVGFWAVPHGCWRVERGAIWLVTAAVVIYIGSLIVSYPGIDPGERSMRVWLITMLIGTLLARVVTIWGPSMDPATRRRHGGRRL